MDKLFEEVKKQPGYSIVLFTTRTGKTGRKIRFKCHNCGKTAEIKSTKYTHFRRTGTLPKYCSTECALEDRREKNRVLHEATVERAVKKYRETHPEYILPVDDVVCRVCREKKPRSEFRASRESPGKGFRDTVCMACRSAAKNKNQPLTKNKKRIVARMPKWQAIALQVDPKIVEVY